MDTRALPYTQLPEELGFVKYFDEDALQQVPAQLGGIDAHLVRCQLHQPFAVLTRCQRARIAERLGSRGRRSGGGCSWNEGDGDRAGEEAAGACVLAAACC